MAATRRRCSETRAVTIEGGIDPALLAMLVCPATRTPLRYDREAGELVSEAAGLAYPIRDGVPVMLIEEARRL